MRVLLPVCETRCSIIVTHVCLVIAAAPETIVSWFFSLYAPPPPALCVVVLSLQISGACVICGLYSEGALVLGNVGDCQAVYHGQVNSAPGSPVTAQTVSRSFFLFDRSKLQHQRYSSSVSLSGDRPSIMPTCDSFEGAIDSSRPRAKGRRKP